MADERPMIALSGDRGLVKRGIDLPGASFEEHVERWASGEQTLKEIKDYSDEDLYQIAQHGYTLYLNGKFKDAQTIFEGLVALDPKSDYYYRALGVVYHRRGDAERAIRQFTHAVKVAPRSIASYVNRAEVHVSRRDFARAIADLSQAIQLSPTANDPLCRKARALKRLLIR
jgi:tetratricopeptide (TPR) repeat protein